MPAFPNHRRSALIPLAAFTTLTAVSMAALAAWDRGGNVIDRALLVALSVAICAGTHLIPALSKRRIARLLWVGCLLGTVYSHLVFFTYASLHAGEVRAQQSAQVTGTARQIEAAREALAAITARPVSVIASDLAATQGARQRSALRLELAEAQRAAVLRDELVRLSGAAMTAEVTASSDPVTERIAAITGSSAASIGLVTGLAFSILLELVGALLWVEALRPSEAPAVAMPQPADEDPVANLRAAIESGKVKATVAGIRAFLGCSQAKAMELRRSLGTA